MCRSLAQQYCGPGCVWPPEGHADMFPFNDQIDSQFKWSHLSVNIDAEIATAYFFHLLIAYNIDVDYVEELL